MDISWRSLIARALHRNRALAYSRYVQLATVRPDGLPANRTVVFRGFAGESDVLKFITDTRSRKVGQLKFNSWGEVCWYFPKTREQFRLLGKLSIVDSTSPETDLVQMRRSTWQELSDNARIQFTWAEPGILKDESSAPLVESCDRSNPTDNFCLLLLQPIEVDLLELRGEPQNRYRYVLQNGVWSVAEINP